MKYCVICKFEKDENEFYENRKSRKCKKCSNDESRIWRENNKEKMKEYRKRYREENKENILEKNKEWKDNNRDRVREKCREYYENNKDVLRDKQREYHRNKKESDPIYKLKCYLRSKIKNTFLYNGYTKKSRTYEILGCSFEEFKIYLESKFEPWMTWENRGLYNGELNFGWDIDHIIPLSSAKTEEDIIKLNHYTNLQPLCSKVNRDIKRDKSL